MLLPSSFLYLYKFYRNVHMLNRLFLSFFQLFKFEGSYILLFFWSEFIIRLCFHFRVRYLVGELRSCISQGMAPKYSFIYTFDCVIVASTCNNPLKYALGNFLAVQCLGLHCRGQGFNPWSGNQGPARRHAAQPKN